MEISVNLVLAVVLTLLALFVAGTAGWLRKRMVNHDLLQTFSGAAALMLVPANLVFAWSGLLGNFTGIVIGASILAATTQLGLMVFWHRSPKKIAPALEDTVEIPLLEQMRVLAVGIDVASLEREAGDVLAAFHQAGQEVLALVVADETSNPVRGADKTIRMRLPNAHLDDLQIGISAVVGEHITRIRPHVVLAPSERQDFTGATAVHWATRRAADGADVLYYSSRMTTADDELDPMSLEAQRRKDTEFRRPNEPENEDDGRIRMPSFAAPWV